MLPSLPTRKLPETTFATLQTYNTESGEASYLLVADVMELIGVHVIVLNILNILRADWKGVAAIGHRVMDNHIFDGDGAIVKLATGQSAPLLPCLDWQRGTFVLLATAFINPRITKED